MTEVHSLTRPASKIVHSGLDNIRRRRHTLSRPAYFSILQICGGKSTHPHEERIFSRNILPECVLETKRQRDEPPVAERKAQHPTPILIVRMRHISLIQQQPPLLRKRFEFLVRLGRNSLKIDVLVQINKSARDK